MTAERIERYVKLVSFAPDDWSDDDALFVGRMAREFGWVQRASTSKRISEASSRARPKHEYPKVDDRLCSSVRLRAVRRSKGRHL